MRDRDKIYKKYNGHCAYCGITIMLKQMQVDHLRAVQRGGHHGYDNYNPACRSCNVSKATYTVEEFRVRLITDVDRIRRDSAKFRILERFGIIKQKKKNIRFYFENHGSHGG